MRPSYMTTGDRTAQAVRPGPREISNTPTPRSPLGNNLFLDGGDAHHVEPARRLGSQQHLGLAGQLTSEQQPLEVAAGQHAD